ncbi:long-chain fatty acid--CoA ligase [Brevibacterium daeguense]|uniref:Long-chain fatty acid--CoA ligase n=1 Tax=Brevibacterium daeguense TaxID=909936 RepID=A0ABP8EFI1_9MICO|nr:class I adenylate-forming enzyme family protein [Brevibacterium daeguense]
MLHSELTYARIANRAVRCFAPRTAVIDGGYSATYEQHFSRVASLIAELEERGIRRYGVLAYNGHEFLELWHAALCGPGTIAPLNFRLAAHELRQIISDSGMDALLVDSSWRQLGAEAAEGTGVPLVDIREICGTVVRDGTDGTAAGEPKGSPVRFDEPPEDGIAALMYTGGTTGTPKAAVLSNRAMVLNLHHMDRLLDTGPDMRFLLHSPMFHGGPVYGVMNPLGAGGSVVLIPKFDVDDFGDALLTTGANATQMGPTMLRMLLNRYSDDLTPLRCLRTLLYGTAPITRGLVEEVLEKLPDLRLNNGYGMTEATSALTILTHHQHVADGLKRVDSVGRPFPGVDIRIVGLDGRECAADQVGEIQVRAGNLMDEYWNRPELTEKAFDGGWYHSGDLGFLDDEGFLYVVDRLGDMIISGGENVYSAEVENVLSRHPAVSQVAVIGRADETWGERVHAVIVLHPGVVATPEELDSFCRPHLAGYKIPRSWQFRDEPLPVSGVMKINKRALKEESSLDVEA